MCLSMRYDFIFHLLWFMCLWNKEIKGVNNVNRAERAGFVYAGAAALKLINTPSVRKAHFFTTMDRKQFYGQSCSLPTDRCRRENLASARRSSAPARGRSSSLAASAQRDTSPDLSPFRGPLSAAEQPGSRASRCRSDAPSAVPPWLTRLSATQARVRHPLSRVSPPLHNGPAPVTRARIIHPQPHPILRILLPSLSQRPPEKIGSLHLLRPVRTPVMTAGWRIFSGRVGCPRMGESAGPPPLMECGSTTRPQFVFQSCIYALFQRI